MTLVSDNSSRFKGVILGTAVGDALGLPAEGMSHKRIGKLYKGKWRHRWVFRKGMVSDDTEHTVFVAQCLLTHPNSSEDFAKRLGWCLRWWLLSLPAGVGLATLKGILRLWLGFRPSNSGVYSAGNGPAMRSALIGAFFPWDFQKRDEYVRASTRMTHTDPRAFTGAKIVADLAAWVVRGNLTGQPPVEGFLKILRSAAPKDDEMNALVDSISTALKHNLSVSEFAAQIGLEKGVTGYIYHTVPVVAYAWYKHFGDFEKTLSSVLDCGGDTDTTGAIAGALAGAVVGEQGIPKDWLEGVMEWPRSLSFMRKLSHRLGEQDPAHGGDAVSYFWPGVPLRNLIFILVILIHILRRLAPPY